MRCLNFGCHVSVVRRPAGNSPFKKVGDFHVQELRGGRMSWVSSQHTHRPYLPFSKATV